MRITRKRLISIVLLCALAAGGIALIIKNPPKVWNADAGTFAGFVEIPAYAYAVERSGGRVVALRLGDLLEYKGYRFSPEDFAATQVVVFKMPHATDAVSVFERIILEYPLLERFPLDGGLGRYACRLGDRHAVFMRGRTVVHISVPEQMLNGGELVSEAAHRMFAMLQSKLKADWLAEIEPAQFTPNEDYERLIHWAGGNVAIFKLTDQADFVPPEVRAYRIRRGDCCGPVRIAVLEVSNAAKAKQIAEMLGKRIPIGVFFVEDPSFEEPVYVISDRRVIFTRNNYVVEVVVFADIENQREFILDLARRINTALVSLVATKLAAD